jgi:hypothetical protein
VEVGLVDILKGGGVMWGVDMGVSDGMSTGRGGLRAGDEASMFVGSITCSTRQSGKAGEGNVIEEMGVFVSSEEHV